jgi:hypothetical protein
MTDPDATKRIALFMERRHVEALLDLDGAEMSLVSAARDHLRAVLGGARFGIRSNDPRQGGGDLIDSGTPHDQNHVLFDTRSAILPEEFEFAVAHGTSDGNVMPDAVAMLVRGHINRPPDHEATREAPAEPVQHLHLMPWEAAADIIVDIQALAGRDGSSERLREMLEAKWADLAQRGLTRSRRIES